MVLATTRISNWHGTQSAGCMSPGDMFRAECEKRGSFRRLRASDESHCLRIGAFPKRDSQSTTFRDAIVSADGFSGDSLIRDSCLQSPEVNCGAQRYMNRGVLPPSQPGRLMLKRLTVLPKVGGREA